jgi:hypothetical protein
MIKNNADIRRVLGVGLGTLADHLREYKDPFEMESTESPGQPLKICSGELNLNREDKVRSDRRQIQY